ncbi:MAG: phasin family protein [Glycocaulis sp.]
MSDDAQTPLPAPAESVIAEPKSAVTPEPARKSPASKQASVTKTAAAPAKKAAPKKPVPAPAAKKAVKAAIPAKASSVTAPEAKQPARRQPSPPRKYAGKITGESFMATAAKKDFAKETIETFTSASNEALKEGFEKSLGAMSEFSAFQKDSVEAVIASATTTSKAFEELNALAVGYAKKSMEDSMGVAKSLASAKSVQEVIEIHADFTKSSLESYLAEMNKVSDHVSAMVKDSMKPLNDRFAAAVEMMQSQR